MMPACLETLDRYRCLLNALWPHPDGEWVKYSDVLTALAPASQAPDREQAIHMKIIEGKARAYERMKLCPDHRDKTGDYCIVCQAEKRTRDELQAQASQAPPQEPREPLEILQARSTLLTRVQQRLETWKSAAPTADAALMERIDELTEAASPALRVEGQDWQPIESAPKDGTWMLMSAESWRQPAIAQWSRLSNCWQDYESALHPTHWMNLPAPPLAGGRVPHDKE